MNPPIPDWLARRDGQVRKGTDENTWNVVLTGEPLYRLALVPVGGKHGCTVTQLINGRRLDTGASHASPEAALQGGLEDLRKALGW